MNERALQKLCRGRLFNAIRGGNIEIVRDVLAGGWVGAEGDGPGGEGSGLRIPAMDPNVCDRRGTPALIRAVRSRVVESGVVDALLEAGADPQATDAAGLTALDYARRRLARFGPGPDRVHRSRSLDEHGNLRLSEDEQEQVNGMKAELARDDPAMAADFEELYLQERRKAALRQFRPRRELAIIVARLEEAGGMM